MLKLQELLFSCVHQATIEFLPTNNSHLRVTLGQNGRLHRDHMPARLGRLRRHVQMLGLRCIDSPGEHGQATPCAYHRKHRRERKAFPVFLSVWASKLRVGAAKFAMSRSPMMSTSCCNLWNSESHSILLGDMSQIPLWKSNVAGWKIHPLLQPIFSSRLSQLATFEYGRVQTCTNIQMPQCHQGVFLNLLMGIGSRWNFQQDLRSGHLTKKSPVVLFELNNPPLDIPWRIHGAGIYANIKGVYWWDPCYHVDIYIYSSTMDPSWVL